MSFFLKKSDKRMYLKNVPKLSIRLPNIIILE